MSRSVLPLSIATASLLLLAASTGARAQGAAEYSLEALAPLSCDELVAKLNTGLERKDAQALYSAGVVYDEGACVARDAAKAAFMLRGALDAGHPKAAAALALLTGLGDGVAQDYAAAGALVAKAGVNLGREDQARQGPDADYTRGYAYTWLQVVQREFKYPKELRATNARGSSELQFEPASGKWKAGSFRRVTVADEPQVGSRIDRSRGAVAQAVDEAARAASDRVPAPDKARLASGSYGTKLVVTPGVDDQPADIGVVPIIGNVPRALRHRRLKLVRTMRRTLDFLLHDWLEVESLSAAPALRRSLARDLRRGARHLRTHRRARSSRPSTGWSTPRSRSFDGERVMLPRATHEALAAYVESGMLAAAQDYEHRRHAAAVRGRDGGQRLLQQGQRRRWAATRC